MKTIDPTTLPKAKRTREKKPLTYQLVEVVADGDEGKFIFIPLPVPEGGLFVAKEGIVAYGRRIVALYGVGVAIGLPVIEVDAAVKLDENILGGAIGPHCETKVVWIGNTWQVCRVGVVVGYLVIHAIGIESGVTIAPVFSLHSDEPRWFTILVNGNGGTPGADPRSRGFRCSP